MRKIGCILVALLFVSVACLAQSAYTEHTLQLDDPDERPSAGIDDMAWMAGHWRGEGFGGTLEEVWAPPLGSTMSGAFKLTNGDSVVFYELMAFVEEGNSLALWVKHFNPDFTGWEEKEDKMVFPLVRLDEDAAYFHGLTLRRVDPDAFEAFLAMKRRGGAVEEARLTYRRHSPPGSD